MVTFLLSFSFQYSQSQACGLRYSVERFQDFQKHLNHLKTASI